MAGHSHWAGIKHKKAALDAKRGKLWSKLSRALTMAARLGGGDADSNPRLRLAVADARAANMPNDTIDRAIKKGAGGSGSELMEEIIYEAYGPHGVAIMCDVMTDNRNRTAPELRKLLEMHGGKLAASGSVAWLFERKGLFMIPASAAGEEQLMEVALDAGASDIRSLPDSYEVLCDADRFAAVSDALDRAGIAVTSRQIARIPTNTVELDADAGSQVIKLLESLDDHDDVQSVSANFNLSQGAVAQLASDS
jgi:YebC/PmpR family DNA-binding regulatory protein